MQVNYTVHMNNIFIYTIHSNCIVQYSAISMYSKHKTAKCCFFFFCVTDEKTCGSCIINYIFFVSK